MPGPVPASADSVCCACAAGRETNLTRTDRRPSSSGPAVRLAVRSLVLSLVFLCGPLACQRPAAPPKGKSMSVIYEARVRQARWIAGSSVVLDLRIDNQSAAPFETPDPMYRTSSQPHFELTGPDGRKQEFRPDSRATDWDRSRPPTLVRLAPGQHWEGD